MAFSYPRKQTFIIFLVCILAVGIAICYVFGYFSVSNTTSKDTAVAIMPAISGVAPLSTSTDWQKQFFQNASTTAFKASKKNAASGSEEPLTATDLLGREFFAKYMQMRQANLTTDPATINAVTDQLVNDSVGSVQPPQAFTITRIHITDSADSASLQSYAESILSILHSYIPDETANEAVIAQQALNNNDMAQLKKIDPLIKNYQSAITALLTMSVPRPVSEYHLNLANGMQIALFNARAFRKADVDPVSAMAALSLEMAGLQTMNDALKGIKDYFINQGVSFSK